MTRDYATAANWYKSAADQGNPTAQYALGLLCYKGEGIPKDFIAAHMWFDLAAAHGDKLQPPFTARDAASYRAFVDSKLSKEQLAEAQKRTREWKPQ